MEGHVARLGLAHFREDEFLFVAGAIARQPGIEDDDPDIEPFSVGDLARRPHQFALLVVDGAPDRTTCQEPAAGNQRGQPQDQAPA